MSLPTLMVFRGAWSAHGYFYTGDAVTSAGVAYVCTRSHRATLAPAADSDHWQELGVLLGEGGTLPAPELPADVAFTDVVQTFSQPQTIQDGSGNDVLIVQDDGSVVMRGDGLTVVDSTGLAGTTLFSNLLQLYGGTLAQAQLNAQDLSVLGAVVIDTDGLTLAQNVNFGPSALYSKTGPASAVRLAPDGTVHLQTAESGPGGDAVSWTDALVVNNDGSLSIPGDVEVGGVHVVYSADSNVPVLDAENTFGRITTAHSGVSYGTIFGLEAQQSSTASYCTVSIESNETTLGSGTHLLWRGVRYTSGVGTVVATLDSQGLLTTEKLALSSSSTTTAAPTAGPADALPATPSTYLTVSINGTDYKIPAY